MILTFPFEMPKLNGFLSFVSFYQSTNFDATVSLDLEFMRERKITNFCIPNRKSIRGKI